MSTTTPPAINSIRVIVPIYWHFNTLDVHAPCEILGNAFFAFTPAQESPFVIQIAAEDITSAVPAYEQVSTQATITFADAQRAAEKGDVDVMVVPGAGPDGMSPARDNKALAALIKAFIDGPQGRRRTLISICTGAELVGDAGGFVGRTATTHWAALSTLAQICSADDTTVVRKRWVDSGMDSKTGLQVISSGGISCGIDACLYFVGQKLGTQMAVDIAQMMDYDWKAPHLGLQPSSSLVGIGLKPTEWTTNQW
jgi:transcriptional regulator GlxA family with amidase domain